jgi:hypothetical protein
MLFVALCHKWLPKKKFERKTRLVHPLITVYRYA